VPASVLIAGLLAVAVAMAFWQVSEGGFLNYDDDQYVTENPDIQAGLTRDGAIRAFTSSRAYNWHPLTWLSHMLDVQMYGMNPAGHHVTNLVLHVANTLLLFWVLLLLTGGLWRSALVAALFGLHPLHVESVAWIAERKDVLGAFFWMLTTLAYIRYTKSPRFSRYAPVAVLFALGLMSKPMLVTLPFTLLLLDYWPLRRLGYDTGKSRSKWLPVYEKIPLFLLSAASSVVTYIVQQRTGAVVTAEDLPTGIRAANALVAYVSYIAKMLWPAKLAIFYPYPAHNLPAWKVAGAAVLLALITAMAFRAARSRPYLAVGWFWYLGTLVPVIGLVQVGMQAMADRYTYIPLIGLFIAIAWSIPERPPWSIRIAAATAIAVLLLAALTSTETGYWRDDVTIFNHAIASTESNYVAHNNLGIALSRQDRLNEAIAHYRAALMLKPDYSLAHFNLAAALSREQKAGEAIAEVNLGLKTEPDDASAHMLLGMLLAGENRFAEAETQYRKSLEIRPDHADTLNSLGVALANQSRFDEAIVHYSRAIVLQPGFAMAHSNLAIALYSKGRYAEAWRHVALARKYGFSPPPSLLQLLSRAMPEPGG
jgi:Flp pilus assembly protein TadD